MIIVTGAAGFIGSCMVAKLNAEGFTELILVDDFLDQRKLQNTAAKQFQECVQRDVFFEWIKGKERWVQMIIHLGARTDTTEQNVDIFDQLNLRYSQSIWKICVANQIPLLYASSAATYGDGGLGFEDDHNMIEKLKPLNPYGKSKQQFDLWALQQKETPFFWAGLKFFNVYGPNEYHKGRMASVIFHTFNQISSTGKMKLFRSHRPDFKDGEQMRDFIYVKDLVEVLFHFMRNRSGSGLYNLGTGKARTFKDLATAVFHAMELKPNIEFIDTPIDIRDSYQYFTEAKMSKLREQGFEKPFFSLEEGVNDYVREYLKFMGTPGSIY